MGIRTRAWTWLVVATLVLASSGAWSASRSEPESGESPALRAALEKLQRRVDELRPYVEVLEVRENPPTASERRQARPSYHRLSAAIRDVERLMASTGTTEVPEILREARELHRRMAALDLVRRAAELRTIVDEILERPEPPSDAERARVRRLVAELQAALVALAAESQSLQPESGAAGEAERAATLTRSAEALAQATDHGDNQLEAAGLRRARAILVRLLTVAIDYAVGELRPPIERLESLQVPPPPEELLALEPRVTRLRNGVDAVERDMEDAGLDAPPDALLVATDLIRRFANLELRASLSEWTPFVDGCEAQETPLAPEQIERLRQVPGTLRPEIRNARRTTKKQQSLDSAQADSPEVAAATALLKRVTRLVPDSPLAQEEPVDAPDTQPVARFFRLYGGLRLRLVALEGEQAEIDGQTSRAGIRLEGRLGKRVTGLARVEIGFNFLDTEQLQNIDEGRGIDVDTLLFHRLSFVGVRFKKSELRFGKQWSAYYDVAVFADQMPYFGGQGTGVYAAGTDGGIAGTGRADQALQLSNVVGAFKYTLQAQIRNESVNNQAFADTYGASLTWVASETMQIGAAFNAVRDGIPDPDRGEPKEGDRALILGYRYRTGPVYSGVTLSVMENHEIDERGVFFGGYGLEAYGSYEFARRFKARLSVSALTPDSDYIGEYRVRSVMAGLNYDLSEKLDLVFLGRADFSKLSDGSDRNAGVLSLALFFTF